MKALPTQQRAIAKRQSLIAAAADEFAGVGFQAATAKSIAAAAGVATGTFYQYFENKDDILRVIAEARFVELHEQISRLETDELGRPIVNGEAALLAATSAARTKKLLLNVLTFLYQYHLDDAAMHQVLDQRRPQDAELDKIMSRGEQLMRSHVVGFVNPFNLPNAEMVVDSLIAMGEGLVHHMVFASQPDNPKKMLEVGVDMLAGYFQPLSEAKAA